MRLTKPNIAKLKAKKDVERLTKALRDGDSLIRMSAANALGEIGDPRAVEPLAAALRDSHSEVANAAAGAMGKTG
jgi:HEAT repeat protein